MAFYFFSLSSPCLVTQNCFTQYSIIQKWEIRCSNFLSLLVALEVEPCGPCSMLTYVQIQGSDDAQHLSAHMHACTHTCKAFGKTLGAATKDLMWGRLLSMLLVPAEDAWGLEWGFPLDTNSQQTPIYINYVYWLHKLQGTILTSIITQWKDKLHTGPERGWQCLVAHATDHLQVYSAQCLVANSCPSREVYWGLGKIEVFTLCGLSC